MNSTITGPRKVWRYQRGNQKSWIEKGLTIQWPKYKRRKDRQYNDQKITTKGQTIQWPKDKRQKDRQYNDQNINYERTDNTMTKI